MFPGSIQNNHGLITDTSRSLIVSLYLHLRVKKVESFFNRANSLGSRFPGDYIRISGINNLGIADLCSSMVIKDLRNEIVVPIVSIVVPKIRDGTGHIRDDDRKLYMIMDFLPDGTPGSGPNARMTIVNLNDAVVYKNFLDLKH
jgi:hypothetical protein